MDITELHGPTVAFITIVMVTVLMAVVLATWRFNRGVPGLREWAFAGVCSFLLMSAVLLRPRMPELPGVLVINFLSLAVASLNWFACKKYVGNTTDRRAAAALAVGLALALIVYLTVGYPDPADRFIVQSFSAGAFYFLAAHVISIGGLARHPARYLFALALVLHGAFLVLFRPWLLMVGNPGAEQGKETTVLPALVGLESMVFLTLLVVGVVMLTNEHIADKLMQLAEIDALTDVFNRRAFMLMLNKACSHAKRLNTPLVLMVIDLDHFKRINDNWGHKVGDDVLRSFAGIVKCGLRNEDVIGRLGGEEFCIFLPSAGLIEAREVAERLRSACAADEVVSDGQTIRYTVSIGIALFDDHELAQACIHRADQAMYRAKNQGRNRVKVSEGDEAAWMVTTRPCV